ncbi:hypothetical protein DEU56DRAFT_417602 [Suillus clintonianus]|uniref:uncharacterized protein n=1 Tax=Suillus clintonianus TaxID=1904413 RepID=UPI001B885602|nr:uncharacterized protein DEU56DRAFT_417602 [Suillus clintonianus]KAG2133280.1 hypothetical protein DEU56DRAFT_417602 [Suillus clintonianus]
MSDIISRKGIDPERASRVHRLLICTLIHQYRLLCMATWTIFSPQTPATNSFGKKDPEHPMRMNIYRVMKAVYHMLDPSNEPSSTVDEVKHIATLEYTALQEKPGPPDISNLFIHLRLSTEIDTRFTVVCRDMQIEDKGENVCISLPSELTPVIMDISGFVREFVFRRPTIEWKPASEIRFCNMVWQELQAEKYHQRVSQHRQEVGGGTDLDTIVPQRCSMCSICTSSLTHCNSCQVASCRSLRCRGSSEPPLARCISHPNETLCFPCLEEQGSRRKLEKCPVCEFWCRATDMTSCCGHPIIPPISRASSTEEYMHVMTLCYQSDRVHPPKIGSCNDCMLPGWQSCRSNGCWSAYSVLCPECTSNGVTCMCQSTWACDICAEHDPNIFIHCPRCDRPFCTFCTYIDTCGRCERASLCNDCIEEASDADDSAEDAPDADDSAEDAPDADDCAEDAPDADDRVVERVTGLTAFACCGKRLCDHCVRWHMLIWCQG